MSAGDIHPFETRAWFTVLPAGAALLMSCSSSPAEDPHDSSAGSGGTAASSGAGGRSSSGGGSTTGVAGDRARGGATGGGGASTAPGTWVNVTANLGNMSSVCGNTYRIWAAPTQDKVLAAVVRVGIYATTDGGTSWTLEGGATSPNHDHNNVCFDPDHPDVYWVAGMHVNPGVFKTSDGGASFEVLGSIKNIDDVSVDFTDPDRKTLLAGAHEQHLLYRSTDGGVSFSDISAAFPSGNAFTFAPIVVDGNVHLMGTSSPTADASEGVFRTSDGGASWKRVSTVSIGSSGLKTSWGSLFYMPKAGGSVLKGSADGATWTAVPVPGAKGYANLIELPGNRIATVASNAGGNSIIMSGDDGETWMTIADKLPAPTWWNAGIGPFIAYNSVRGAFFASYYDCGLTVHSDSIWRYDTMIE